MKKLDIFKSIYRKPKYIALNVAAFIIYYYIMHAIVLLNNPIILFSSNLAEYAFYGVVLTSSVLITLAVFSAFNTRNNMAKLSASTSGSVVAVASSFAVSCGCGFSALSYLAILGIGSGAIVSIDSTIADYETPLLIIALIINIVIVAYYTNKLSNPACKLKKVPKRGHAQRKRHN